MYTLKIIPDDYPENPREEWDHVSTMACWHNRYDLGDERPKCDPIDHMLNLVTEFVPDFEERLERKKHKTQEPHSGMPNKEYWQAVADRSRERDEWIYREFEKHYLFLPLHLYDHSGVTMSVSRFSDPWDSGQVGFIYVSKKKARAEFGRLTKKTTERVLGVLRAEVEVYGQYLTGDIYGFQLYKHEEGQEPDEGEELDSCWGFYGSDPEENGMVEYLPVPLKDVTVVTPW